MLFLLINPYINLLIGQKSFRNRIFMDIIFFQKNNIHKNSVSETYALLLENVIYFLIFLLICLEKSCDFPRFFVFSILLVKLFWLAAQPSFVLQEDKVVKAMKKSSKYCPLGIPAQRERMFLKNLNLFIFIFFNFTQFSNKNLQTLKIEESNFMLKNKILSQLYSIIFLVLRPSSIIQLFIKTNKICIQCYKK